MDVVDYAVHPGEDDDNQVVAIEQGRFKLISNTSTGSNPLGAAGAVGDYLDHIVFPRGMVAGVAGLVLIKDGGVTKMSIQTALLTADMPAGTTIPINAISENGTWDVTIQALSTVEVCAVGRFTDS